MDPVFKILLAEFHASNDFGNFAVTGTWVYFKLPLSRLGVVVVTRACSQSTLQ